MDFDQIRLRSLALTGLTSLALTGLTSLVLTRLRSLVEVLGGLDLTRLKKSWSDKGHLLCTFR